MITPAPATPAVSLRSDAGSTDNLASLSATFYSGAPGSYLNHRLESLIALGAAAKATESGEPPRHVEFRGVEAQLDANEEEIRKYSALETTVLMHHAAETLLRLYLAHAESERYPWMQLAQLTNARSFKEKVKVLRVSLSNPETVADLVQTCSSLQPKDDAPSELVAAWNKHSEAVTALFRRAADVALDDAPFYNSAKHGLATLAADSGFSLTAETGESFTHSGDALTIIEVTREGKCRTWRLSTLWVDVELNLQVAVVLTSLINSLWNSARQRRGLDYDASATCFFDGDAIHDVLNSRKEGGIMRMSMPIETTIEVDDATTA